MSDTTSAPATGWLFFTRFLRSPRAVGALCPSTRHLGAAMLEDLELARGDVVLEYGPGTGGLTQAILARSRAVGGLRYLGIEREAEFCSILRTRMPELEFAHGQVEDVEDLLAARGLPPPRAIISGLPLILLPNMQSIVATAARVLATGGSFRTFSYLQSLATPSAHRLRDHMRASLARYRSSRLIWRNFPPAFVLRGDKAA